MSFIGPNRPEIKRQSRFWEMALPDLARKEVRPKGVDLFAGAGGFSLGACLAGIDIVAAVEKDKHACTSYEWNLIHSGIANTRIFSEDILRLDPGKFMSEAGLKPGECHVLLGGPPCQGFSAHRLNGAGIDDPRNKLLLRYFEYVRALRPAFFIVENVPGMLWPRHKAYVEEFRRLAIEAEYDLPDPFTLNARNYGVPQNRKRVFLFGRDKKRPPVSCTWPPPHTHRDPNEVDGPSATWLKASAVFETPLPADDPNGIHMNHGADLIKRFQDTPINGGSRAQSGHRLKCHEDHDGHSDVYGRIDPSAPGPTMTTACINPSKGRFVHPTEPHGITLRQAARFQTFPDWFIFAGGLMAGGTQVGNAVPVQMAQALLEPIVHAWKRQQAMGEEATS